ncbi:hypothetical protein N5W20_03895 [Candidatus Kirkpatrickella diaphorinae]|uniref:Uncharacterized protein n=1 Tax=Candidatus Kirkpatrickella diaphorinae TaxID=2984322 RepID=A0ABY6GKE6_9PROT|nr:hypothetical protein [Candidatus Kirkpatrickella diaphorinae]UYH52010.1 hypothetical protein N5W20_03895 [Candidatus Kirkpatrickella diaphorinae]
MRSMKSMGLSRHRVGDLGQSPALQRLAPALSALISTLIRTGKPVPDPRAAERAAHRLNVASATLAASVLMDSAVEHYRGSFKNPAMYTPLLTSAAALAVSLHGTADHRRAAHVVRDSVFIITGAVGVIGTLFHLRNVYKRTGRLSWQNLFYGAPLGAPFAIGLSGMLGHLSERVRATPLGHPPNVHGIPAGRVVSILTSGGLMGTTAEAWLLHFRGSYHNLAMYLPVTMPPVAAALLLKAASGPAGMSAYKTRWWLRATAAMGFAGTVFHAIGVGRDMDGWRNWQQNILNGPPLPAPPAYTGLALAGLAALGLMEDHPDD